MVLQTIRDRITGILAVAVLGILIVPFAFVGVNSYFQSGTENLVAMVNDQEITFADFNQSYLNHRRRMQSLMGEAFDPAQYDSPIARREHLDQMIDENVLAAAAEDMGLEVDNDRLAEQIRSIPAFQVDGAFNTNVYQARLQAQGLSAQQFESNLRASMMLAQLPASVSISSFTTNRELQKFIALQNQTRSFRAIVVAADEDTVGNDFSDEEINAWYEGNPELFQSEERVVIEYLELDAGFMAMGQEPDEELLRERFETQQGRFLSPEQRQVAHVLIEVSPQADEATLETARQEAEDVARRARAGEDFAELANELSDDAGSAPLGGDLGWVEPGVMVDAFEDAMYELTLEQPFSDPVQTGFGWHVIQVRDIRPSEGMDFAEARHVLLEEYYEEIAEREFLDLADRMVDVVYEDPTTLEAAALDLGLDIQTAGPFGRAGGAGVAANREVVATAYSDLVLLQGSVSDPVDLGPNHMIMLRVAEHMPVALRPLEEAREEILASLRSQRADEAARSRANELLTAAGEEGVLLEDVAAGAGFEVVTVEAGERYTDEPDSVVVRNVFKLRVPDDGDRLLQVVEAGNGHALVELTAVEDGVLEAEAVLSNTQFRRQLANASASAEAWALVRQLREQSNVQVFEENLGVSR